MKLWLWRVMIVSAIGAYLYYNRKLTRGDGRLARGDRTVGPAGAAAGP